MRLKNKGIIFLLITVLFFSTFEVTGKLIGGRLHPFQISFLRFFTGGLILLPFAIYKIRKGNMRITASNWRNIALLGTVNIVISMGFLQFGLLYTGAAAAAVIFSSNPVAVALFAGLILKEKIGKNTIIGLAAGVMGVIILFADKISLQSTNLIGPLFIALSAVFYGLYTVLGKKIVNSSGIDSLVMTSLSFIAGSLLLLPVMYIMHVPVLFKDMSILPHMLYLAVFVSGVAYMCYFYGLANVAASTGSLVFFVKPVLAVFIAVIALDEQLTLNFFAGTAVIILSIVFINLKYYKIRSLFEAKSKTLQNK